MSVGSKIRMIPILIVLAVGAVAGLIYMPQFTRDPDDYRSVVVLVVFTPPVRTLPVKIDINAGGDKQIISALESPVERTFSVKTGKLVTVKATQPTGLQLTCLVKQLDNGRINGPKTASGANASIPCSLVVT